VNEGSWGELAAVLAANPGLVEQLLVEHVDRGDGVCAACRGRSAIAWPCPIRKLAEQARSR
jgi:hypothetical protein